MTPTTFLEATMKRVIPIVLAAAAVVLLFSTIASSQPANVGGLTRVVHDGNFTGSGTSTNALALDTTIEITSKMSVGTSAIANPTHALDVSSALSADVSAFIWNTNTAGYSGLGWNDSSLVYKGSLGYGNSTVALTNLRSKNFFASSGPDYVFADTATGTLQLQVHVTDNSAGVSLADGASSGLSAASEARIRYNLAGGALQASLNGGAYFSLASTSVVSGTTNTIAKFSSATSVGNSLLTDDGTTFAINTNKFTVTEASGNTAIAGTLAVTGTSQLAGGTYTASMTAAADNTYFAWDASPRIGFTKKSGFAGKLTYGSAVSFAISQSNATDIGSANTFTDRFVLDSSGNGTMGGTMGITGLLTATAGLTTPANVTTTGSGDVVSADDVTAADRITSNLLTVNGAANTDTMQLFNTATGQTSGVDAADVRSSGTFDTTAGSIEASAFSVLANSTRSAGANNLINYGIYSSASGGQANYSFYGAAGVLYQQSTSTLTGLVTATAGVTTPANLTTTSTGDLVSGDDLTVADDATITDALTVTGTIGNGVASPTAFHSGNTLFPSATPKAEFFTGSGVGTFTEAVVIRHNGVDSSAVTRRLGFLVKLSSEGDATESNKYGGLIVDSSSTFGNSPSTHLIASGAKWLSINGSGVVSLPGSLSVTGAAAIGAASATAHTLIGSLTATKDTGTSFSGLNTTANIQVTDSTAFTTGTGGGITFAGIYTGSTATAGGAIKAMKLNATDGNYSFDLVFGARASGSGLAESFRIAGATNTLAVTGAATFASDITGSARLNLNTTTFADGSTITNTTSAGAYSTKAIQATTTGTVDATATSREAKALLATANSTRSAGANQVINYAVQASASGGQANYAFYGSAGDFYQAGVATLNGAVTFNSTSTLTGLVTATAGIKIGATPTITSGTGSPEGVVTAPVGSLWLRTDGGASTSHYVKESGAGNTGWVAK